MTVPPAPGVTPVSVEESVTDPPTVMIDDDSVVESVTPEVGLTVRGSQPLGLPLLLASPEYTAFQLWGPAELKVRAVELGMTPLTTPTVDTMLAAPLQVSPVNQLYTTVPPA